MTPWTAALQAPCPSPSLGFALTHVHCVGDATGDLLCRFLLLLASVFSSIRIFSSESALCIRWPKCWSSSLSVSPSSEYSGLISFRIDWFDLLVVQGTCKSLLQDHSLKASVLWCSAFFIIQLSHLYMATGKNHSFDYTNFVSKVISLLFNTLSRFFIDKQFCLLSWKVIQ